MKRIIIGTAGHIDHGKTTLVKALTGVETDRLKEEQQRGISIELGFAPLNLPGGQKAAIVDVPGHERFIRHMMAGAFGIDMVLFTIAADEGIMPQTREHMDIITLLGVNKGIAVITKTDMVDEEWLMMIEEEVREYIDGGILRGAPVVPVSAVSGEGLAELLATIEKVAKTIKEKTTAGPARLPIDRVFSIAGFGTVVTGTLWSGQIQTGDTLELMPVQRPVKVRNLQVHNAKVPSAYAGQRVAVNLPGLEVGEIHRGYLLATKGYLTPSYRVDTRLSLLPGTSRPLKNWNRIRFHLGTDETLGRIILLDRDELLPGEEAYSQIAMEKPVVAQKGDPFVIRYYSPVNTIGGGIILEPNAPRQKRFKEEVLAQLALKEEGSSYDMVLHELELADHPLGITELAKKTGNGEKDLEADLHQLIEDQKIVDISGKGISFLSSLRVQEIYEKIMATLLEYQEKYPLRAGYPKEDMRSRWFSKLNPKAFTSLLKYFEDNGQVVSKNNLISLPGYNPTPGNREKEIIAKIIEELTQGGFAPPGWEAIKEELALPEVKLNEIISYLLDQGELIKISENIYFSRSIIEQGKKRLQDYFVQEKELSLATARDIFNTTRKYALPLVEYYDRIRFTRRVGDMRVKVQ